eukprot:62568-Hanusia_phi.AAC.3
MADEKDESQRSSKRTSWKPTRTSFVAPEKQEEPQQEVHQTSDYEVKLPRKVPLSSSRKPLCDILSREDLRMLCHNMPKIELHAHLSGTVKESTLGELGRAKGLDIGRMKFSLESLAATDSLEQTWKETVEAFDNIRKLTAYDPQVLRRIVNEAIELYAEDGCVYLELRTGLKHLPDRKTFLSEVISTINVAQGKHGIIVRLLVSVDRGASLEDARETISIAIDAYESQSKGGGLRGGGVLVGVEMGGNPLRGNWDEFRPLFQQARDAGLRVSLHFAENKGYEDEHEKILEFGPDRLGHAVFMSQNITEKVLQKRTPVERNKVRRRPETPLTPPAVFVSSMSCRPLLPPGHQESYLTPPQSY